jgi:glycosyltransferase involved in cell wall biosynthesis
MQQNKTNLGYNKNFEKALLLAGGDVLAIADQDDVWHPRKIEILIAHWPAESPLIYSDSVLFSGQVPSNPLPNRWIKRLAGKDPRQLALFNTISGHAMLIRKNLLSLALPFNPGVYYDWWLAIVAMANGGITYHQVVLVYQRAHPHNASLKPEKSKRETFVREMNEVARNLEQFCKTPNLSEQDSRFFKNLYDLWCAAMEGKKRKELFLFLMKHRKVVYSSKKRKLAFVSHLKRSLRYAFEKL